MCSGVYWHKVTPTTCLLQILSCLIAYNYHSWPNRLLFGIKQGGIKKFSKGEKKLHVKSGRLMKCPWRFNNFSCFAPLWEAFLLWNQSNNITLTRAITGVFSIRSLISGLRSPVIPVFSPFQISHINESGETCSTLLLPIVLLISLDEVWVKSTFLVRRIKCFHLLKFPWLGLPLHNCAWFKS